jgi:hypothetical protein
MDRSQRKVEAETLRNEKENLENPAKKNPGLVNEIDAIQIGEKLSCNFPGKADRQRFNDRVCEEGVTTISTAVNRME